MCSKVAKRLLNGEQVIILNAEKAVFSGKRKAKILEVGRRNDGAWCFLLLSVTGLLEVRLRSVPKKEEKINCSLWLH